jgi:large subunit ribosomal protein L13
MKTKTTTQQQTIDATGRTLGRVSSEVAKILMGKDKPTFERHIAVGSAVMLTNASKAKMDPRKMAVNEHKRYSGYPGGLKREKLTQVAKKKGYAEIFRKAIYGMLPNNKLRPIMMKRLTISE